MKTFALALTIVAITTSPRLASAFPSWGIELGGGYSSIEFRSPSLPAEEVDPRFAPMLGLTMEHPVTAGWSATPVLRYFQQGETSTWHEDFQGGSEEVREHTVAGGIGIRRHLPWSSFLAVSPEVSYLLSGRLSRTKWFYGGERKSQDDDYASRSDRWNVVMRAGIGRQWKLAKTVGSVQLRYVRGINTMTRVMPVLASRSQRNIAWTATPITQEVRETRTEAVELSAGLNW